MWNVWNVWTLKTGYFFEMKKTVFSSLSALVPGAVLVATACRRNFPVVRKNPKDIIDLSILALLAFTLQRYCGFPTCKAMLQLPSEILQPFG